MKRILPIVSLIVVGACTPDVPADPSFQQDVLPVLAANCLRCHSAPQIGGAPEAFRLDAFEDVIVRPRSLPEMDPACNPPSNMAAPEECFDEIVVGASSMSFSSALRVADEDRPMPPRFQLDDHQIELFESWVAAGSRRGEPRPGNARPQAAIDTIERTGALHRVSVRVDDADRDPVGGSLHARIAGTETFVGFIQSGLASVTWDSTGVATGSYPLSARLDDGAAVVDVSLGTITVGGP